MTKSLYLVRRSLETYLGPMDVQELVQSYRRMDFGLQDEVCGNQGPWIAFDDIQNIKKHYPQLAESVRKSMLAGWAPSGHNSAANKPIYRPSSTRRLWPTRFLLTVAVMTLTAGILFVVRTPKTAYQLLDSVTGVNPSLAAKLLGNNDRRDFQDFMARNYPQILAKTAQSRSSFQAWLPYLRAYAYMGDGTVPGLAPQLLRGASSLNTPSDCSSDAWSRTWLDKSSLWSEVATGQQLPLTQWSRLLLWDPDWIVRRTEIGWIEPLNYYVACLRMAEQALAKLASAAEKTQGSRVPLEFSQRLSHLMAYTSGLKGTTTVRGDSPLSVVSCYEISRTRQQIDQCNQIDTASGEWDNLLRYRSLLARIRIALAHSSLSIDHAELSEIQVLIATLQPVDNFTKFDYTAEWKFLGLLEKSAGNVGELKQRLENEYPSVNFSFD